VATSLPSVAPGPGVSGLRLTRIPHRPAQSQAAP
jgi:hypothetical protein